MSLIALKPSVQPITCPTSIAVPGWHFEIKLDHVAQHPRGELGEPDLPNARLAFPKPVVRRRVPIAAGRPRREARPLVGDGFRFHRPDGLHHRRQSPAMSDEVAPGEPQRAGHAALRSSRIAERTWLQVYDADVQAAPSEMRDIVAPGVDGGFGVHTGNREIHDVWKRPLRVAVDHADRAARALPAAAREMLRQHRFALLPLCQRQFRGLAQTRRSDALVAFPGAIRAPARRRTAAACTGGRAPFRRRRISAPTPFGAWILWPLTLDHVDARCRRDAISLPKPCAAST